MIADTWGHRSLQLQHPLARALPFLRHPQLRLAPMKLQVLLSRRLIAHLGIVSSLYFLINQLIRIQPHQIFRYCHHRRRHCGRRCCHHPHRKSGYNFVSATFKTHSRWSRLSDTLHIQISLSNTVPGLSWTRTTKHQLERPISVLLHLILLLLGSW